LLPKRTVTTPKILIQFELLQKVHGKKKAGKVMVRVGGKEVREKGMAKEN
jgi:hypothetical protein